MEDGTPAPQFDLSLFPPTFQTGQEQSASKYSAIASVNGTQEGSSKKLLVQCLLDKFRLVPHLTKPMVELLLETPSSTSCCVHSSSGINILAVSRAGVVPFCLSRV